MRLAGAALFAALAASVVAAGPARAAMAERRFALSVGQNVGAANHAPLRFAEADASRFASTLQELGGFSPDDVIVLRQATLAQFRAAVRALELRVAQAKRETGRRSLLLFYWSGHATEQGLEFGAESLPFGELKRLLEASGADVRLAFVDACRSGGLVSAKGARPTRSGFELTLASEHSPDGTAIVASSGPGENALESAELRGSFFTHHLTAGLRGAADADGDGRVTFQEAYRYAYSRTVAQSVEASGVPQRPTYAMALKGKGELVLAELQRAEGQLVFAPSGAQNQRWLVVREDGLGEVLEIRQDPVRPQTLALPSGRYRLVRALVDDVRVGGFALARGDRLHAEMVRLSERPYGEASAKGDLVARSSWGEGHAVAAFGLQTPQLRGMALTPALALGARVSWRSGQELHLRGRYSEGRGLDSGFPYSLRSAGGDLAWLWPLPWSGLKVGASAGAALATQRAASADSVSSLQGRVGAVAAFHLPLVSRVGWVLQCEPHLSAFRLNEDLAVRPGVDLLTGLEVRVW